MLTASSSATVVPFQPTTPPSRKANVGRPTFQQAREAWLDRWYRDSRVSRGDKAFLIRFFLHFNRKHYDATGELLAWPSWGLLEAETGLAESTVFRRLRSLERLGALDVEHGRYNITTKKRAHNKYRAIGAYQPCIGARLLRLDQPCIRDQTNLASVQGTNLASVQDDSLISDSLIRDSLNQESKGEKEFNKDSLKGRERGESEGKSEAHSANSKPYIPINPLWSSAGPLSPWRTTDDARRAAEVKLEEYRRRAASAGGGRQ
jgi:hypothetical protein